MIDIVGDSQLGPVNHPAWNWLAQPPVAQRLGACARAVGLLLVQGHPDRSVAGTAFLISERRVITNRHVADYFAGGSERRFPIFPGMTVRIDFARQIDGGNAPTHQISRVLLKDKKWDFAVLELASPALGITPLRLTRATPNVDANVAVIGYPTMDDEHPYPIQEAMLRGRWPVKRLQPGKYFGTRLKDGLQCMVHDCSTLKGNSGSPLIDIATGEVFGLHFWGRYLEENHAHPMSGILQEPRTEKLALV